MNADSLPPVAPDALRAVVAAPGSTLSDLSAALRGRTLATVRTAVEALLRGGLVERDKRGGLVATRQGLDVASGVSGRGEEPGARRRTLHDDAEGLGDRRPIDLGDEEDDLDEDEDEAPPAPVEAVEAPTDPVPDLDEVLAERDEVPRAPDEPSTLDDLDRALIEALRRSGPGRARDLAASAGEASGGARVDATRRLAKLRGLGLVAVSGTTAGARWHLVESLDADSGAVVDGPDVRARVAELRAELRALDLRRVEVVASIAALERASGRRG